MGSLATTTKVRVAIAGGGIGGLCLALGLCKFEHIDVHVYEVMEQYRDTGSGLAMHGNAIRAMELIDPALKDAYFRKANSIAADDELELATQVVMAYGANQGQIMAELGRAKGRKSVSRLDLLDGLRDTIPAERIHLGKRLAGIEESEDAVTLKFADGSTATADCLIGADGIHSLTRSYLLGPDHPAAQPVNHEGWYRYVTAIPMEEARKTVPEKWIRTIPILCGPKGVINALGIRQGKTYTITVARKTGSDKAPYPVPRSSDFEGYSEDVINMVKLLEKNPKNDWKLEDHDPAPFYARGRVAMIGDAAHATFPFNGNGAAQAIEDAAVLTALFSHISSSSEMAIPSSPSRSKHPNSRTQILTALLHAFDETRRPRSQRVVEVSREFGRLFYYDFGDVWREGDDMEKLRAHFQKLGAYTNEADLTVQNQEAVELFKSSL